MSVNERLVARALARCSFPPGSWDKRFCRNMAAIADTVPEKEFTERQSAHLLRLAHKYRRQLSASVVESALDEMEAAANRRVQCGRPALPDFTPARVSRRKEKAKRKVNGLPSMPLFGEST